MLAGRYQMVPAVAVGALAATATTSDRWGRPRLTASNLIEVMIGVALLRRVNFRRSWGASAM